MSPEQGFPLRSVTQKRNQGHVPITAWKRAVQIIKCVPVTVGPYFVNSEIENRTKKEIWAPGFDKIRDLFNAFRIFNIKGLLIWIKIKTYTNSIPKNVAYDLELSREKAKYQP